MRPGCYSANVGSDLSPNSSKESKILNYYIYLDLFQLHTWFLIRLSTGTQGKVTSLYYKSPPTDILRTMHGQEVKSKEGFSVKGKEMGLNVGHYPINTSVVFICT